MKEKWTKILATGCGAGYLPKAPGTFGSLWGLLVFWLLSGESRWILAGITVLIVILAIRVSTRAESVFGEKDSQKIVIDEVAGQLVTYLLVPFSFTNLIIGFLLFRLFDVIKIFPARWAQDHLKAGLGVVGDDVVAGIQAGLVLWGIHLLLVVH